MYKGIDDDVYMKENVQTLLSITLDSESVREKENRGEKTDAVLSGKKKRGSVSLLAKGYSQYRQLLPSERHALKTGGAFKWVDEGQIAAHHVSALNHIYIYIYIFILPFFQSFFYLITFFMAIRYFAVFLSLASFALDTRNPDLRSPSFQLVSQTVTLRPA